MVVRMAPAVKSAPGSRPKVEHTRGGHVFPQQRKRIIVIDDCGGIGSQARNHLAFGTRDAFQAAEALQVLGAGIGDDADRGTTDAHQRLDFTGAVGSHLHHCEAVLAAYPEQRQGHADVIVEIAAGAQARAGLGQDAGNHFLDRGLAIAAGNANDWNGKALAPGPGASGQRLQCVIDQNLAAGPGLLRTHHGAGRAARHRRGHIVLPIEAWTRQCDEQLTGVHSARVGRDSAERAIGTDQPATAAVRECRQRGLHDRPSSTPRATCSSLNTRRVVPWIW